MKIQVKLKSSKYIRYFALFLKFVSFVTQLQSTPKNTRFSCRMIETKIYILTTFRIYFRGAKAPSGPRCPRCRGFTITLSYAPCRVKILWSRDRPVVETQKLTTNHTQKRQTSRPTIPESEGPQTHFKPRGHWNRQYYN